MAHPYPEPACLYQNGDWAYAAIQPSNIPKSIQPYFRWAVVKDWQNCFTYGEVKAYLGLGGMPMKDESFVKVVVDLAAAGDMTGGLAGKPNELLLTYEIKTLNKLLKDKEKQLESWANMNENQHKQIEELQEKLKEADKIILNGRAWTMQEAADYCVGIGVPASGPEGTEAYSYREGYKAALQSLRGLLLVKVSPNESVLEGVKLAAKNKPATDAFSDLQPEPVHVPLTPQQQDVIETIYDEHLHPDAFGGSDFPE